MPNPDLVPDEREAIIEAMAEAMWLSQPGPRMPYWNQAVWERFATAAYDASPIERYRKALEEIQNELGVRRALVQAAVAFDAFIEMVESGQSVFAMDPEDENSEPKVYERVREGLAAAVAPFKDNPQIPRSEVEP